jgi:hypothetical protein
MQQSLRGGDFVRSKSEPHKTGTVGIILRTRDPNNLKKIVKKVCYIIWDGENEYVPMDRKEFVIDHERRNKKLAEENNIKKQKVDEKIEISSKSPGLSGVLNGTDARKRQIILNWINPDAVEWKNTQHNDYYHIKKNKAYTDQEIAKVLEEEEIEELEKLFEDHKIVDTNIYKNPDLTNVIFKTYIQSQHPMKEDYSTGPKFVVVD